MKITTNIHMREGDGFEVNILGNDHDPHISIKGADDYPNVAIFLTDDQLVSLMEAITEYFSDKFTVKHFGLTQAEYDAAVDQVTPTYETIDYTFSEEELAFIAAKNQGYADGKAGNRPSVPDGDEAIRIAYTKGYGEGHDDGVFIYPRNKGKAPEYGF